MSLAFTGPGDTRKWRPPDPENLPGNGPDDPAHAFLTGGDTGGDLLGRLICPVRHLGLNLFLHVFKPSQSLIGSVAQSPPRLLSGAGRIQQGDSCPNTCPNR